MSFDFEQNVPITAAIHAYERGERGFAQALLERGMAQTMIGHGFSPLAQRETASARERVAYVALTHYAGLLPRQDADRRNIYENLKRVYASGLVKRETRLFGTVPLLDSLLLSLRPIRGTPGSIERAVDELVYCSAPSGGMVFNPVEDPLIAAVKAHGLNAVPELAKHVNDHRLTWSMSYGMNNAHTRLVEVWEIVRSILSVFSEGRLASGENWNEKEILGWLRAKELGREADYFLKLALRRPADTVYGYGPEAKTSPEQPDWRATQVLVNHYPEMLPTVLKSMAREWPDTLPSYLVSQFDSSKLPTEVKRDTFDEMVRSRFVHYRVHALQYLQKYDVPTFERMLIPAIASIPLRFEPNYSYAAFFDVVDAALLSTNPETWSALSERLKSATPLVRVVVLSNFSKNDAMKQKGDLFPVIRFLVGFANETEIGQPSKGEASMYTGLIERYSSLTAGQAALRSLASVLNLPVPDEFRTGEGDCDGLRERVRAELKAQGLGFLASRME